MNNELFSFFIFLFSSSFDWSLFGEYNQSSTIKPIPGAGLFNFHPGGFSGVRRLFHFVMDIKIIMWEGHASDAPKK